MSAANKITLLVIALGGAACSPASDASNDAAANAPMDVETLPADESDTTPTNELENGVDKPEAGTADLNSD